MNIGVDYIGVTTPFYCTDGKGNFLFHKRSKNCRDEQGRWDTGGGKLEFGQTLEENVLREVKEEYGCRAIIIKPLPPYSLLRQQNGRKTHWIAIPYLLLVDPETAKINEPEKIDEIGWFPLSGLPRPLHTGVRLTLKKYKKELENFKLNP